MTHIMARASTFVFILFFQYQCAPAKAEDAKQENTEAKKSDEKNLLPDVAKRLQIDKPTKTSKFETVKSKKHNEEYDLVIDEAGVKETPFTPEEIRRTLIDAMDSRSDRTENNEITIEIGDQEKPENEKSASEASDQEAKKEAVDSSESKKILVGKIKKKEKPKDARSDSKIPGKKDMELPNGKFLKTRTEGACEQQNKALRDAVQFPNPV